VTILPFLAVTFGAAAASLLTRRYAGVSAAIGLAGLAAAALAAAAIHTTDILEIGGSQLVGSEYLRLFALLGSVAALVLATLGLATTSHRHAPGVLLAGMGAAALALALPDARIAVMAATAGGLTGILVTIVSPPTAASVIVAVRELRAVAVAGFLAILAAAWLARPLGELAARPEVFGLAYLGFAAAVAIRFGAIPFHFWAARLADAAPEVTLPMLMAWGPASFAIVALAWTDQSVAPLLLPLTIERGLVVAVGVASILLGSLAAWIQDDLEHVVGYTIVADAGVAILGLAALDPAAWEPARSWILVFAMVRSAFAGWVVAIHAAYGTRRIGELRGWAMRTPLLGVALVVIAVAAIGWPGLLAWNVRAALIQLTVAGPIGWLVVLGAVAPVAIYARLLVVGLGRPATLVALGHGERPTWPAQLPSRPMLGRGGMERAFERASHAVGGSLDVLWTVPAGLRANRSLIAGVLVLVLGGLSFVVSSGGLGVSAAAAAVPAQTSEPIGSEPPGSEPPSESESPGASEPAGGTEPPVETESPGEGSPSPGSLVAPSVSGSPVRSSPSSPPPSARASAPPIANPSFQPLPTF
jgi:formate hydrogenlyase subunit 3/multisubunit Na+/H+ antiporter MnhD subunit